MYERVQGLVGKRTTSKGCNCPIHLNEVVIPDGKSPKKFSKNFASDPKIWYNRCTEKYKKMNPKITENAQLKKTEKEHVSKSILKSLKRGGAVRIWKKIQILLLAAIFAAGCTVIVYESPERRARSVWEYHWHSCPYGDFWGYIYWQCMWYHRYPYYSRILSPGYRSQGRSVITKQQLKKPTSSGGTTTSTKVTKRKVVKTEKEKPKKVIKKKKDV